MQFKKIIGCLGCILACCSVLLAFSQNNNALKGNITDEVNGNSIKNVHIVNLTQEIGTVTNFSLLEMLL